MKPYIIQLKKEFDTAIKNDSWPPLPVPNEIIYPKTTERIEMYDWIKQEINYDSIERMIDIGMLGGRFIKKLQEYNIICDGIDISCEAVKAVKANNLNGSYFVSSIDSIPFEDNTYDWVNCISVVEYNPTDTVRKGLLEINRILKNEGRLTINFPDENSELAIKYSNMEKYMGTEFHIEKKETIDKLIENSNFSVLSKKLIGMANLYILQK